MKQFFKITLACMLGFFICSIVWMILSFSIFGAIAAAGESTTKVEPNSVYKIKMSGVIRERSNADPFGAAIAEAMGQSVATELGLDDILANIKKAKNDENIVGIHLDGGTLMGGYASIKEIRDALLDFKASGKFITAYADTYVQSNYYLASVADKLMLNAIGSLDWRGMSSQIMFYTGMLDKLGVDVEIVKVGTFKSAVEPYMNTKMSDANRLQMQQMIDGIWNTMLAEVGESRHFDPELLNRYADEMMAFQTAEKVLEYSLVDSLVYANEVDSVIKTMVVADDEEAEFHYVSHNEMIKLPVKDAKFKKDKVAVIYAEGAISDSGNEGIIGADMVETINEVAEKSSVKAVVFRVNSPGGSAYASEQIWNALRNLKTKKPLIVSMGDYAASGGYYIACLADTIVAQPTTLTGSIGVFGMIPNLSQVYDKVGLTFDGVKTNKMSDMLSDLRGMSLAERNLMQQSVNHTYELFTQRCADGRGMTQDAIKAIGEGRVWMGQAAVDNGLVDMLGSIDDAIAIAADKAGLEKYGVSSFPAKEDTMTRLMKSLSGSTIAERIVRYQLGDEAYQLAQKAAALKDGASIQAAMPYEVVLN